MPNSKKKYIAAGLIAAGSAAAVAAYAVRRRRDRAVDAELAGMLNDADTPPVKASAKVQAPALSGARSDAKQSASAAYKDLMAAKPADAKANPVQPA